MRPRLSAYDRVLEPAAIAGLVFLLAPLVMVVVNSIGSPGIAYFPPTEFSLASYFAIPERWLIASGNSVIVGLAAAACACILGTCAALALARGRLRNKVLIDAILRSPLQVPAIVLGVAFLQYYAWLSQTLGIQLRGSYLGLIIAHTAVSIPYVLTVVLARLASFDVRLEEAAYGLGASAAKTFFKVTLPIIAPAVLAGGFFAFLLSLDNVPLSLFLVSASTPLLPVDLFTSIQFDLTRPIYAVATLTCLLTTLMIGVAFRHLTSALAVARM